jgi:hypothetical protein
MTARVPARFRDSSDISKDGNALRSRLGKDGYLFLPGLLDRRKVESVRSQMLRTLAGVGWLAPGTDPDEGLPGPETHHQDGLRNGAMVHEEGWYKGYIPLQRIEAMHALAHEPPLVDLMAKLFGSEVITHPRKVIRVTFPGDGYPTPPHQDLSHSAGLADVLTAWVPIGDCPLALGGLWILRGSATGELRPQDSAHGVGGAAVVINPTEEHEWVCGDYRAGDVLIFHSLTIHQAPANEGGCLRLSADFRYQSVHDPVKATWMQPHYHYNGRVPPWSDLTQGWRSKAWVDVPRQLKVKTALINDGQVRSNLIPLREAAAPVAAEAD